MKTKFFFTSIAIVAIAAALSGCGNKNTCTINGTLVDAEMYNNHWIYLEKWEFVELVDYDDGIYYACGTEDSTLVENGHFSFTIKDCTTANYRARTENVGEDERYMYINFVAEPGTVELTITNEDSTDHIGGTALNDTLQKYTTEVVGIDESDTDYELVLKQLCSIYWRMFENNRDNVLALHALNQLYMSDEQFEDEAFLDSLAASTTGTMSAWISDISARLQKMKAEEIVLDSIAENTSAGHPYIDVPGIIKTYSDGTWSERSGSLKELIDGHYALVDFWASWCGPCRQEIKENLIRINELYKDKGLVVVGLDVRDNIPAHAKAVEQLGITYPQLIDTTSFAMDSYGVHGIPVIILVGPDGTILARDIRGDETEATLKKAMKIK